MRVVKCSFGIRQTLVASDVSVWTRAGPWPVLKHRSEVLGL